MSRLIFSGLAYALSLLFPLFDILLRNNAEIYIGKIHAANLMYVSVGLPFFLWLCRVCMCVSISRDKRDLYITRLRAS